MCFGSCAGSEPLPPTSRAEFVDRVREGLAGSCCYMCMTKLIFWSSFKRKKTNTVDNIVQQLKESGKFFPKNTANYETTARSFFANVANPNNVTFEEFFEACTQIIADKTIEEEGLQFK